MASRAEDSTLLAREYGIDKRESIYFCTSERENMKKLYLSTVLYKEISYKDSFYSLAYGIKEQRYRLIYKEHDTLQRELLKD